MADNENTPTIDVSESNARILHFLQTAQYAEAEKLSAWLISTTEDSSFEPNFYLGVALQFQGKVQHALEVFKKALDLSPNHVNVMQAMASCLEQLGRFDDAYNQLIKTLEVAPNEANLHANIGAILEKLKRPSEALAHYDHALMLDAKNYMALINRGGLLASLGRKTEGLNHCRIAHQIHPQSIGALFNLADALLGLFKYDEALAYCDAGLAWQPRHANLLFKKGVVLSCLKQFDEAHQCLAEAQVIDPKVIENVLPFVAKLGPYTGASLSPQTLYLDAMYQAQIKCFWQYRDEYIAEWQRVILHPAAHDQAISNLEFGFQVISLAVDGQTRLKLGQNIAEWVQDIAWLEGATPFDHGRKKQPLKRIAYFSADFRIHPVGLLSRQIYGLHDKNRFEIFVYSSFNAKETDHVRHSIEAGCTQFRDVSALSDNEIAQLIYQDEIDVLVELTGISTYGRPKVMAMRPAPIQIAYLGYPSTSGAEYMDYAITDNVVAHRHEDWSECLVYMPHAFNPYDNETNNSATTKTRKDYQLSDESIVFCCFNNNYKIDPEVFSCWMRILHAVPNSVLWLLAADNEIELRLKEAAKLQFIESSRLVFAPYAVFEEYLARYQLADILLDTFWHNAHTTAADALWQGLPVITCAGEVISSRLAASLLNALEMPELITHTFAEYEALAIYYATHHEIRLAMREKLKAKRYTAPLFDTVRTTRNLERAYQTIWQRYCDNLPPIDVRVVETD